MHAEAQMDLETLRVCRQRCRLMKVLSNPDRLLLLCQLTQAKSGWANWRNWWHLQPTLSQQLGVLRGGPVNTRREGKTSNTRSPAPGTALMNVV